MIPNKGLFVNSLRSLRHDYGEWKRAVSRIPRCFVRLVECYCISVKALTNFSSVIVKAKAVNKTQDNSEHRVDHIDMLKYGKVVFVISNCWRGVLSFSNLAGEGRRLRGSSQNSKARARWTPKLGCISALLVASRAVAPLCIKYWTLNMITRVKWIEFLLSSWYGIFLHIYV